MNPGRGKGGGKGIESGAREGGLNQRQGDRGRIRGKGSGLNQEWVGKIESGAEKSG